MAEKITISQCMIVKDEEENIETALTWGRGAVDEQIVVDTGSRDRTAEIAKGLGARVYEIPWEDDFAKAKNFAISKARGEWIVFLDADERLSPEGAAGLRGLLRGLSPFAEALWAGWVNLDGRGGIRRVGTQIRIFRNLPGLCYHRRIHEQLGHADGHPLCTADASGSLFIYHTGYTQEAEEKKAGRNLRILLRAVEESPEERDLYGYLGDEYASLSDTAQARFWYEKALDGMETGRETSRDQETFRGFMRLEAGEGNEAKIRELYEEARGRFPRLAVFDYMMGHFMASRGSYNEGAGFMKRALEKAERWEKENGWMMASNEGLDLLENLTLCCGRSGRLKECMAYGQRLLAARPYALNVLGELFGAARSQGMGAGEAMGLIRRIYPKASLKDRLFCLRAARDMGWSGLEDRVLDTFSREERACLEGRKGEKE